MIDVAMHFCVCVLAANYSLRYSHDDDDGDEGDFVDITKAQIDDDSLQFASRSRFA